MNCESEICPTCGRKLKAGVKSLDRFMTLLFIASIKLSKHTTVKWRADRADSKSPIKSAFLRDVVFSKDIRNAGFTTRYARLGDLKYWHLLEQDPEHWHQGIYQVTDLGKKFLNGEIAVPKQLKVSNGRILETSQERVDIKTALGSKWNEIGDWISDWRKEHADANDEQGGLY